MATLKQQCLIVNKFFNAPNLSILPIWHAMCCETGDIIFPNCLNLPTGRRSSPIEFSIVQLSAWTISGCETWCECGHFQVEQLSVSLFGTSLARIMSDAKIVTLGALFTAINSTSQAFHPGKCKEWLASRIRWSTLGHVTACPVRGCFTSPLLPARSLEAYLHDSDHNRVSSPDSVESIASKMSADPQRPDLCPTPRH